MQTATQSIFPQEQKRDGQITIRLPKPLLKELKKLADAAGLDRNAVAVHLLSMGTKLSAVLEKKGVADKARKLTGKEELGDAVAALVEKHAAH